MRASQPTTERAALVHSVDVSELEVDARTSLHELGIEWLLLIHLPARDLTPGTLVVGFRAKRVVDQTATRLLEVLGDRLALILASIDIQDQSGAQLQRAREEKAMIEAEKVMLEEDRRFRDELVATISHDLRSPLSIAKMGAELIKRGGGSARSTESLANKILRNIDRSDRMIHDLLDSYRIRAGKRLPLSVELFPMDVLATEVVKEMAMLYGDRFDLRAEPDVVGYWSRDGMRRLIENLLSNAAKYGDPDTRITVTVEDREGKMRLTVNNRGAPMTNEEQARILQPYERGETARRNGNVGWGIGLTLVRGITDAHGGTLHVISSADQGTSFIVENPMDSRPFLQH